MDTLPIELTDVLLHLANDYVACSFVCKLWYKICRMKRKPADYSIKLAKKGHLGLLKWAVDNGCPIYYRTAVGAAKRGRVEVLRWLNASGCSWNATVCNAAIKYRQYDTFDWLVQNDWPWDQSAYYAAISNDDVEGLNRVHKCYNHHDYPLKKDMMKYAAVVGGIDAMKWLVCEGLEIDKFVVIKAVERGHLNMLEWMKDNKYEYMSGINYAAYHGHLHIIQWAEKDGYVGTHDADSAASGSQLHILKWLTSKGWKPDDNIIETAAYRGSTDIIQWCLDNGVAWSQKVLVCAIACNNIHVVEWAMRSGLPCDALYCIGKQEVFDDKLMDVMFGGGV